MVTIQGSYVNCTINWVTVSMPLETATSINGPLFKNTMLQSWQWIALMLSPSISCTKDTCAFKKKMKVTDWWFTLVWIFS